MSIASSTQAAAARHVTIIFSTNVAFSVRFRLKGGCAVRFSRVSVLRTSRVHTLSACFEHGVKAASRSHVQPSRWHTKQKERNFISVRARSVAAFKTAARCRVQNSCTVSRRPGPTPTNLSDE